MDMLEALILFGGLCLIFGVVYPVTMAGVWAIGRLFGSTESFKSYMNKI